MKFTEHLARLFGAKGDVPASTQAAVPDLIVGGLYSALWEEGGFAIVKVLVLEPGIVHVRIYKNRLERRPQVIDQSALSLGTIHDADGFGVGHMPVSDATFAQWEPVFVARSDVKDEELEGYKYWKENSGGGAF